MNGWIHHQILVGKDLVDYITAIQNQQIFRFPGLTHLPTRLQGRLMMQYSKFAVYALALETVAGRPLA